MDPEKSGENRYVPGEVVTTLRIKGSADDRKDYRGFLKVRKRWKGLESLRNVTFNYKRERH